jgi:hypothetical protein
MTPGPSPHPARRGRRRALAVALVGGYLALLNHSACSALRVEPVVRRSGPPLVDEHLELARAYAPWIFHAVHPSRGRQDLPAPVDFDGDLDGGNNWEHLPSCELVPTAGYSVLETATHWFVTWHLFHPRDWELIDLGVHLTHEGDGENLQVVVDKASGDVVLLYTQAHYRGGAYARGGAGFADGEEELRGEPLLLDESGRPDPRGRHAAVFVESRGHGIYGAGDSCAEVALDAEGRVSFEGHGIVLRPARAGEAVSEPALDALEPVPYQLESMVAKLWPLHLRGELCGEGRLLDGPWPYRDGRVEVDVPRYHEGDRFSGPLGPDRGISPYAVDYGWKKGVLGALYFDPARRHAEVLKVPEPWSLEYVGYPFAAAAPAAH